MNGDVVKRSTIGIISRDEKSRERPGCVLAGLVSKVYFRWILEMLARRFIFSN